MERILKENPQLVIFAPQDNFLHGDSNSKGQDYWIGTAKRDWRSFLGVELPSYIAEKFETAVLDNNLLISGISMGAHGAIDIGVHYPNTYKSLIALSPIFKGSVNEVISTDSDIFTASLVEEDKGFRETSLGVKLYEDELLLPSRGVFIEISKNDFGLDLVKFPTSKTIWDNLRKQNDENESVAKRSVYVQISDDSRGHHHGYWKDALARAVKWQLSNQ